MATLGWNDVIEVSHDDAKQSLLLYLKDLGYTATTWQPFAMALVTVELGAELRKQISQYSVFFKNAFMAETASGEALTRTARSFYNTIRNSAVATQLLVTLVCDATNGPHPIDVGELTFGHSNGSTYRNVDGNEITYPATLATSGTIQLLVESETAGILANIADSTSASDVTLELQTTLSGVTITAHALERSGLEEESDARLTERCQLRWSRNVPRLGLIDDGVRAIALETAPAVISVAVDSTNPRGQGTFDVWLAGLDATASAEDVNSVQLALDAQTFGRTNTPKTCLVRQSPELELDLAGVIYFSGALVGVVRTVTENAILEYLRSINPGGLNFYPGPQGVVPINDIEHEIRQAVKSAANNVTVVLTNPPGNLLVPAFGKVVRGDWSGLVYQLVVI